MMFIVWLLIGAVVGLIAGFFIAQKLFKKQLRDNPPINEDVIVAMMSQMGRKPSQKQVNQVMKQVQANLK